MRPASLWPLAFSFALVCTARVLRAQPAQRAILAEKMRTELRRIAESLRDER